MTLKPEWVVYILRCADESLYTGITNNLESRLKTHEEGRGAKYLRGKAPLTLVYSEVYPTRSAATKREIAIKSLSRAEKIQLIKPVKIKKAR